jgi:hypothetical protein
MMPEIPVDFPEYDYSLWRTYGGAAAGTFAVESPFGSNPCEVAVIMLSCHTAATFVLQDNNRAATDGVSNGAQMFYTEISAATSISPPLVWVPTSGRLTLTTTGTVAFMTVAWRRKSRLRHVNPPLDATHHYTPENVHIAHEEAVNARKC